MKDKSIILTGGGSAGHVTPNLALIEKLKIESWQIYYLGSEQGIERDLIKGAEIPYFTISTGKLRRYFSWRNFIDPFKVLWGLVQAFFLCRKLRPTVIFSKGGFVAFPVVVAAWLNRIPVVVHESDFSPGLANRLSFPFAKKICLTFAATKNYLKTRAQKKAVITGTPIRSELFHGDAAKGRELCGFTQDKKIILVQGGGLGAGDVNAVLRKLLPRLLDDFQVVHGCGKGKVDVGLQLVGYKQFEYIGTELSHIIACADLVISRAGANSVCEILALKKPNILLPLSKQASRGDQLLNAKYSADLGLSRVIYAQDLSETTLWWAIEWSFTHMEAIKCKLADFAFPDAAQEIYLLIDATLSHTS
jgi:UDP-N-acetylglucosamine--N-acetylmuramyl-(pentapeptide) pyrophosphoryl-undecaprenol N-acetylglucosamine transferase